MDDQSHVQDGEIIEETSVSTQTTGEASATILESLESLIKENLGKIDRLTEEAKQQNEMIQSVLENDEVYREHEERAKDAAKVKNATKSEILKRPDVRHVFEKLKELKLEIKEIKESMNSYLQEYQRLSGSTEIEDDNGEVMQIIYVAKLIKRRT